MADAAHVGALEGYVQLFRQTKHYQDRWNREIIPVLLYAYPRTLALEMARSKGFKTVRYLKPWIQKYYREVTHAE